MVVASHALDAAVFPRLAKLGHPGVLIFFSLSGFLITFRLLEEYRSNGDMSIVNFYVRRFFRIIPPLIAYLSVVYLLTRIGLVVCNPKAIRAALLFYTNYSDFGDAGWRVAHFWSLSVEEHFYLVWPLLLLIFGIKRGSRTALALIICVIVWRVCDNHYNFIATIFHSRQLAANSYRSDLIADALLWGCLLAFYKNPIRKFTIHPACGVLITVSTFALLIALSISHIQHITVFLHLLPALLLASILFSEKNPANTLLQMSPLRFIGRLSYSVYIWQQLLLGGPGAKVNIYLSLLLIAALSFLSYTLIELPCMRYGKLLISRRQE